MRAAGMAWNIIALLCVILPACSEDTTSVATPRYSERSDSTFTVGGNSVLEISNFAGRVRVASGAAGQTRVVATKWAAEKADLGEIEVEMVELSNGVRIQTNSSPNVQNVSVDLSVTVPPDARPAIGVAAGSVDYEGQVGGAWAFTVGAGSATIRIPKGSDVEVHLSVGAGKIRVDFQVDGLVEDRRVDGIIGTGTDGTITAEVAAGNIVLTTR